MNSLLNKNASGRVGWIDAYRGLLIFFVVIGHAVVHSSLANSGIERYVWSFHLAAFFFISGMLFRRAEGESFGKFALRKFRALMIPYYCFSLLSILIFFFAGRFMAGKLDVTIRTTDIPANLLGMLYANSRTGYMKWNFPTWFIPCLFVMELLFFWIDRALSKRFPVRNSMFTCAAVWIAVSSIVYSLVTLPALPLQLESTLYLMPFFIIGRGCVVSDAQSAFPASGRACAAGVLLAALGGVTAFLNTSVEKVYYSSNIYGNIPLFYLSALLSTFGWALIFRCACRRFRLPVLRRVGRDTLSVLLMHKFPLMFFQLILGAALMRPAAIALPVLIADSAAAVALSLLAGAFIRRFLPFVYGKSGRK